MFRIDDPSAATARPASTPAGTPGFFTQGDPVAGQPATIVTADFLNMIQEELIAIVQAAGISLSKTNFGQVLAALQLIFAPTSSFGRSLGVSGYQSFPGGLIMQWAFNTLLPNQQLTTVTFPIAFPNTAFLMLASAGNALTLTSNQVGIGAAPISRTQGQIAIASSVSAQTGVYYLAFGN